MAEVAEVRGQPPPWWRWWVYMVVLKEQEKVLCVLCVAGCFLMWVLWRGRKSVGDDRNQGEGGVGVAGEKLAISVFCVSVLFAVYSSLCLWFSVSVSPCVLYPL